MQPSKSGRAIGYPPHLKWLYKCRGSDFTWAESRPRVDTLLAMAIRAMLQNMHLLTPKMLECVPQHLKQQIWCNIERWELHSIRAIQLFGSCAVATPDGRRSNHIKFIDLKHSESVTGHSSDREAEYMHMTANSTRFVSTCLDHMDALDLSWTTSIKLSDISIHWEALLALGRMRNLLIVSFATCKMDGAPFELDATVARRIGQQAERADHFPNVTAFSWCGEPARKRHFDPVTMLPYLSHLESLKYVCIFKPHSMTSPAPQPTQWTEEIPCVS